MSSFILLILWYLELPYTYMRSFIFLLLRDSLVAQMVKKPPAMGETRVQSLGWEDPLEKGIPDVFLRVSKYIHRGHAFHRPHTQVCKRGQL